MKEGALLKQHETSIENPHQIEHAELINIVLQLNNIQFSLSQEANCVCFSLLSSKYFVVSSAEVLPELEQRGWQSGEMAEVPGVLRERFWAIELRSKSPGEEQTGTSLLAWLTILGIDWCCYRGSSQFTPPSCCMSRGPCI